MSHNEQTAAFIEISGQKTDEVMQCWHEELKVIQSIPVKKVPVKMTWQQAEQKAYSLMGLTEEYANFQQEIGAIEIPGRWIVHMVKDISYVKIIDVIKMFGSSFSDCYDNLDKKVVHDDRNANRDGSYARSFLASVEADRKNANKSFIDLRQEKCYGITLMEFLFLQLVHFLMTGGYLDVNDVTLCSGSLFARDNAPYVVWDKEDRRFRVYCHYLVNRSYNLRSRCAFTLPVN